MNISTSKTTSEAEVGGNTGLAVAFAVFVVLGLSLAGFFVYRKIRSNRHHTDEFLLTDSVFRYDGYTQVDEDI